MWNNLSGSIPKEIVNISSLVLLQENIVQSHLSISGIYLNYKNSSPHLFKR
ncbi:hypothetical protein OROGR_026510 [Orobanche gracilis]